MAEPIGTRDEAAADEDDLAQVVKQKTSAGILGGAIRALLRRIEDDGVRLTGAEEVGDRQLAKLSQAIGKLDRSLVARLDMVDSRDSRHANRLEALEEWMRGAILRLDGLGQEAHDRAGPITFPIPAVRPGRAQPRTGPATAPPADDFLSPPPIARAIGRAVMAAAATIPPSNPTNARHFETIKKAADEVKAEAAATLGARLANILSTILRDRVQAHHDLVAAMGDAQRAGVIP